MSFINLSLKENLQFDLKSMLGLVSANLSSILSQHMICVSFSAVFTSSIPVSKHTKLGPPR